MSYHRANSQKLRRHNDHRDKKKPHKNQPKHQIIKFVYYPAHKGIVENEIVEKLARIATKKVQTLEPTYIVSSSEIKTENKKSLSANGKEDGTTQKIINIRT